MIYRRPDASCIGNSAARDGGWIRASAGMFLASRGECFRRAQTLQVTG
jgi:hypothetical protein